MIMIAVITRSPPNICHGLNTSPKSIKEKIPAEIGSSVATIEALVALRCSIPMK